MKSIILIFLLTFTLFGKNHLANEESPYLQQHVNNPVQWYPWGKEAFEVAKKENKLIFLSIGYSTCHWCHVMERESFENEKIAKLLNKNYIAIKVDKEERPDLDKFYQLIHQIMNKRGGGWPLSIVLTPNKKPIFAATYIPAYDKYGMRGLESLLPLIANEYHKNPQKLEKIGNTVLQIAKSNNSKKIKPKPIDLKVANLAVREFKSRFDFKYGGFGNGVKFPHESSLKLLLIIYELTGNKDALAMADKTLKAMAKGGIYDQIEGAFYRYSTRRDFLIPHFEKMLYTNAQLIEIYTKAYLITKNKLYKKVVIDSVKEIDKRFSQNGLYFSASDADTDGVEGGYFLFKYEDALKALKEAGFNQKEAKEQLDALNISFEGNFEDALNNPSIKGKVSQKAIDALKKLRAKREYPFIDKKSITSWNALYIKAKLEASLVNKEFKKEALVSLDALLKALYKDGKLYHQKLPNKAPSKEAMLEDYAFLIDALITANQISLDSKYLTLANQLFLEAKDKFYKNNRWYFSQKDNKLLANIEDSAYSSALGVMFNNMLDLASLKDDYNLYTFAKKNIESFGAYITRSPSYYPTATIAALKLKRGIIVIKSSKNNLLLKQKEIFELDYPFVIVKIVDNSNYQLCTINRCFANIKEFKDIKKSIKTHF
jgi:uncharacterized protein YyaL (SSP411 family)